MVTLNKFDELENKEKFGQEYCNSCAKFEIGVIRSG